MGERLVDLTKLQKLSEGSLENRAKHIKKLISKNAHLFGSMNEQSNVPRIKILATYNDHAIVMNESGQVFRASIAENKVVKTEPIDADVVLDRTQINERAVRLARESIELITEGRFADSKERLQELYKISPNFDFVDYLSRELSEMVSRNGSAKTFVRYNKAALRKRRSNTDTIQECKDELNVKGTDIRKDCHRAIRFLKRNLSELQQQDLATTKKLDEDVRQNISNEASDVLTLAESLAQHAKTKKALVALYRNVAEYANNLSLIRSYSNVVG